MPQQCFPGSIERVQAECPTTLVTTWRKQWGAWPSEQKAPERSLYADTETKLTVKVTLGKKCSTDSRHHVQVLNLRLIACDLTDFVDTSPCDLQHQRQYLIKLSLTNFNVDPFYLARNAVGHSRVDTLRFMVHCCCKCSGGAFTDVPMDGP